MPPIQPRQPVFHVSGEKIVGLFVVVVTGSSNESSGADEVS